MECWLIIFRRNCYPWGCPFSWGFNSPCLGWDFAGWVRQGLEEHIVSSKVLIPWCRWCWFQHIPQSNHDIPMKRTRPGHCCHRSRLSLLLASQSLFIISILDRWADSHVILIYCFREGIWCFRVVRIPLLSLWRHDGRARDKGNHVLATLCSYFHIRLDW